MAAKDEHKIFEWKGKEAVARGSVKDMKICHRKGAVMLPKKALTGVTGLSHAKLDQIIEVVDYLNYGETLPEEHKAIRSGKSSNKEKKNTELLKGDRAIKAKKQFLQD